MKDIRKINRKLDDLERKIAGIERAKSNRLKKRRPEIDLGSGLNVESFWSWFVALPWYIRKFQEIKRRAEPASVEASLKWHSTGARGTVKALHEALCIALAKEWIPHKPSSKQYRFLLLPPKNAFYGGAAGGGKSDALLMGAIMFCHLPGYHAIIFRRTLEELHLSDGLIPRSHEWLGGKARWNGKKHTWTFPSGATITFGYLKNPIDHYRYQSSAYQYIAFDELPQFRKRQFEYMFSRLRKLKSLDIPLRIRGAGNPDGPYVLWVKRRYVDEKTATGPFVPALIEDNPGLDKEAYIDSLKYLDSVTRARLMKGDWEIRDRGRMFNRSWFPFVKGIPSGMYAARYWDRAATKAKRGRDPDWTAGVLMATKGDGIYYVVDVAYFRGTPKENEDRIRQTAILDAHRKDPFVQIFMEQEPGSAGVDVIDHYRRNVLNDFSFRADRITGPKTERASAFSTACEAGNVKIVLGGWDLEGYLDELESFPEVDHDDRVDASSGAFKALNAHPPLGGGGVTRDWR